MTLDEEITCPSNADLQLLGISLTTAYEAIEGNFIISRFDLHKETFDCVDIMLF